MSRAQPFRPFHVKPADGRALRIDHPEFRAVSPDGREMVISDDQGMSLIERLRVVEARMAKPPEPQEKPGTQTEPAPTKEGTP